MISQLKGILIEKQPPYIVLDVHGVGYEIAMPMTCFYDLPENGESLTILTQFIVREDAQLLYGFNAQSERWLFRELIKVNGVGPKLALAILSGLSADQFVQAVEQEDLTTLIKLPGVGKKTAERLLVEMRDRIKNHQSLLEKNINGAFLNRSLSLKSSIEQEAILALTTLGYKPLEAKKMVGQVIQEEMDCESVIKAALKKAF